MDQLQNNKSKNTTTYEKIIAATALSILAIVTFIAVYKATYIAVISLFGDNTLRDLYLYVFSAIATVLLPHICYCNKNGIGHGLMSVILGKKNQSFNMAGRTIVTICIALIIYLVLDYVLIPLIA
ncbi:hypothetical protein [Photobacterium leiognathi]|uniref:hypothetical protein n=1 Tax=Photobacterium leiognathi TaxID=553611 RepID=UPI00298199BB|nr:hypothetical protein [Photobacterium leiognathi]